MSPSALLALGVFGASIGLILLRPRRFPDWVPALGGGGLMMVLGLLPPTAALRELARSWNVFLFFLGLATASVVAERAGLFRLAADAASAVANGSQRRLLVALYVAGVLITVVLSNDAAALLLTPVAFELARGLKVDPLPYALSCALVANAASAVLPFSNPANVILLQAHPLGLRTYAALLLLPSVAALGATLAGVLWIFREPLSVPLPPVGRRPRIPRSAAASLVGVTLLALGYLVAAANGWPLGVAAVVGAAVLVVLESSTSGLALGAVARRLPWGLFPLFGGLLLLVAGGDRAGAFQPLIGLLEHLPGGRIQQSISALVIASAASNVLNNLPTALVAGAALRKLADPGHATTAALLLGVDLGPNLTPAGSISTLLWLLLLEREGVRLGLARFLRVSVPVTISALAAAAAGTALTYSLAPHP